MAIALVGSAVKAVDSGSSPQTASALPTGYTTDDLFIAQIVSTEDNPTPAHAITTSGSSWTQIGSTAFLDLGSTGIAHSVWYRFATSSSETLPEIACPTPRQLGCTITCYRGVDKTTPLDGVNVQSGTQGAQATLQVPESGATLTPTTANAWVMSACATNDNNTLNHSTANGFTIRGSSDHTAGTTGASTAIASKELASGNTAGPTWNQSVNSTDAWAWHAFVLKPRAAAVPAQVTGLVATAGDTEVSLAWSAPGAFPAIDDYKVEYKLTSEPTTWTEFSDGTSTNTFATVTGLTNDLSYDFRVSAHNSSGYGTVSSTAQATPIPITWPYIVDTFAETWFSGTPFPHSDIAHGLTIQTGDVLYAFLSKDSSTGQAEITLADDGAGSSGGTWTKVLTDVTGGTRAFRATCYRKIVTNGTNETAQTYEAATANFTGEESVLIIVQVRNADTTTPEDASVTGLIDASTGTSPTNSAITTVTDEALILLFACMNGNGTTDIAAPSTYTILADTTATGVHTNRSSAWKVQTAYGTVTPGSWTFTGASSFEDGAMVTVAVRPLSSTLFVSLEHIAAGTKYEPTAVLGTKNDLTLEHVAAGTTAEPTLALGTPLTLALEYIVGGQVFEPNLEFIFTIALEYLSAGTTYEPTLALGSANATALEHIAAGSTSEPTLVLGSTIQQPIETISGAIYEPTLALGTTQTIALESIAAGTTFEPTLVVGGGTSTPPVVEQVVWTNITNATSAVVTGPDYCDVGDLLIAYFTLDDTQTIVTGSSTGSPGTIPSGWTEIESGVAKTAGGDVSGYAFYKVAVAGDVVTGTPTTYTWGFTAGAGDCILLRVSGVDTTSPIADTSVGVTASGQTQIALTAVTTSAANSLLVAFLGVDESATTYAPYWSDPPISGWTPRYGSSSVPNAYGSSTVYSGCTTTTQASAGSSGSKTATIAVENDAIVGFLIAVSPTVSAGNPISLEYIPSGSIYEPTLALGTPQAITLEVIAAGVIYEPTQQLGTTLTITLEHIVGGQVFEPTVVITAGTDYLVLEAVIDWAIYEPVLARGPPNTLSLEFIAAGAVVEPVLVLGETQLVVLESIAGSIAEPTLALGNALAITLEHVVAGTTTEPTLALGSAQAISLESVGAGSTYEPTLALGSANTIALGSIAAGVTAEPALVLGNSQAITLEFLPAGTTHEPGLVVNSPDAVQPAYIPAGTTFEPTLVLGSTQAIVLEHIAAGATSEPTLVTGSAQTTALAFVDAGITYEPTLVVTTPGTITLEFITAGATAEPALVLGTTQTAALEHIAAGTTAEPVLALGTTQAVSLEYIPAEGTYEPAVTTVATTEIVLEFVAGGTTYEPTLALGSQQALALEFIPAGATVEPVVALGSALVIGLEYIAAPANTEPTLSRGTANTIALETIPAGTTYEPSAAIYEQDIRLESIAAGPLYEPTLSRGTALTTSLEHIAAGTTTEPTLALGTKIVISLEYIPAEPAKAAQILVLGTPNTISLEFIPGGEVFDPQFYDPNGYEVFGTSHVRTFYGAINERTFTASINSRSFTERQQHS